MRRTEDREALKAFMIRHDSCCACGAPSSNPHHLLPRGQGGDDVAGNLVALCGDGTTRCHGAFHGSPYVEEVIEIALNLRGDLPADHRPRIVEERRDRDWVTRRIGRHLRTRDDVIAYFQTKLGRFPGIDYLERTYFL